ncbi:MAG TPA: hypothetical protein VHU15_11290 [Stellaceae bacterium]|jgi:hypothetical protein|nr:hypothetical protein [Stellaceae bacterium]
MRAIPHLFSVAVGVAALVVVLVVCAGLWGSVGASDISFAGWAAMGFGIVATLAIGIGLMALVFISSRRGYDELDRRSR